MRFGVNTLIWSADFNPAVIPLEAIKRHGIDGIEAPVFSLEFDVRALKHVLRDYDLQCTLCGISPREYNPVSEDPGVRGRALDYFQRVIALAAEAGAELFVGPIHSPVGYLPGRRRTADEWRWAIDFYRDLAPVLEAHKVTLAVEPLNRFETYFLNTAADAVRLVDEVGSPRVGILLDTFHANIEEKDVPAAYRLCGARLAHVHACENDRGIPGTGHVDWRGVFAALQDIGYDAWLTIESFNANSPVLAAATAVWRDLAPSLDAIAFEGIDFLKRMARGGG